MAISVNDKWVWDSWYARDRETWHAYFLQADKSIGNPDFRHWNVSFGHATSTDLVNWKHLGTTFAPAESPAWDDFTTWTGSVVQDDDSTWHLFYTGTTHADAGMYQRIGHATSTDMHNWTRVGDGLCLDLTGPNAVSYESEHIVGHWADRAMRDPWVMRDPMGTGWLMYFTARAPGIAEANAAGAIGFARSHDLDSWELHPPVYIGSYGQLEVPQVFSINNTWYCLFCTAAEHWSEATMENAHEAPVTGNHYLVGDSPCGPWQLPDGPFLDGALPAYRYAGRILESSDGPVLTGFLDTGVKTFKGIILDPVAIVQQSNGLLRIAAESS